MWQANGSGAVPWGYDDQLIEISGIRILNESLWTDSSLVF